MKQKPIQNSPKTYTDEEIACMEAETFGAVGEALADDLLDPEFDDFFDALPDGQPCIYFPKHPIFDETEE